MDFNIINIVLKPLNQTFSLIRVSLKYNIEKFQL